MDPSALAIALSSRLTDLEYWWSNLDSWLNRWTALVVIGVAMEVIFVLWEYRTELHDFRRGTIRSPEKPRLPKLLFELFGAALVAGGVAGEFVVHTRAGKIETEMRDVARQQVSIANGEAAKANERTEELRSANLELERELSPRHLSVQGQQHLTGTLKPFAPIAASLQYLQGDDEARRLGAELANPLGVAWGTPPAIPKLSALDNLSTFGILIGFNMFGLSKPEAARLQGAAEALALALNNDGVRAITNQMNADLPNNPPGLLVVWIGLKPNPIEDERFLKILQGEPEPLRSASIRKWFPEKKR
jgi:hypothetical protein